MKGWPPPSNKRPPAGFGVKSSKPTYPGATLGAKDKRSGSENYDRGTPASDGFRYNNRREYADAKASYSRPEFDNPQEPYDEKDAET